MTFVAPPGYQPIYNPCIPYTGPVFGGLREGMSIYIHGVVPEDCGRFHVNLQCGDYDGCDVALHINPRFHGWDKVVFNTFLNGSWEGEEKVHHMPFHRGRSFELVIVVNSEGYQVNVNGEEYYLYQHRMGVERVTALSIGGDVSIQNINVIGGMQGGMGGGYPGGMGGGYPGGVMGGVYPGAVDGGMGGGYPGAGLGGGYPGGMGGVGDGFYPGANLPVMGVQPIYNPVLPYSNVIPGGMLPKRTIIVRGMVPFGADRFYINFIVSGSRDIAFQLNPRMREGVVIRNSLIGGMWGDEEQEVFFNPFMEGQYFDISIRCGNRRFKVFVNGQHLCNFHHRYEAFTEIDMLEVEGDVQISYIHF
ncbi:galectin-4-like [Chanos chanos]|uniref:Galectin n=1 Tax=Chanos chanos TaxID=29144 RepID=A0A6J2UPK0_CHACN|nr:galectin-4-like [Chanos chanos]